MFNLIDYVENELTSFQEKPFSSVDSLVLSQFVYLHLESQVPSWKELRKAVRLGDLLQAERFPVLFHNVRAAQENRRLLFALAASPRFREIKLNFFANERDPVREKQFAAVTCFLEAQTAYLAFRGTDATLLGWKEDFNMAFESPVPSQEAAVAYTKAVAERFPGKLLLGGHSKGGNLAVYSAVMSSEAVQKRIVTAYSHDGPGFKENIFQSTGYLRVQDRIDKTLPQASVIGMLLESQEDYSVVRSSRQGLMQHDPFSWEIQDDHFSMAEQLSSSARYVDRTLNDWLSTLSDAEREQFAETLYSVLSAGNITSFAQADLKWQEEIPAMLEAIKNIDPQTRNLVLKTLKALTLSTLKNLSHPLSGNEEKGLPEGNEFWGQ